MSQELTSNPGAKVPKIEATVTNGVKSVTVSDDGQTALVQFDADMLPVAIPAGHILRFVQMLSHSARQSERILQRDPDVRILFPCERWEVGQHKGTDKVFLSFRMNGGMEMAFQIPRDNVETMRDSLLLAVGGTISDLPDKLQ